MKAKTKVKAPTRRGKKSILKTKAVEVTCPRCNHKWLYKGEKPRVVCSNCRTSVTLDPKRWLKTRVRKVLA